MKEKLYFFYLPPLFLASWWPVLAIYSFFFVFVISIGVWASTRFLRLASFECAALLLLIAGMLSAILNANYDSTFLLLYALAPLALIGFRRASPTWAAWQRLGYCYIAGCFVVAIKFLDIYFFQSFDTRVTAFDLNGNYLAYCLAMGIAVCATFYVTATRSAITSGLLLAVGALFFAVISLTGSRGALLSAASVALILFLALFFRKPVQMTAMAVLVLLLAIFGFDLLPTYLQNRLIYGDDSTGDFSSGRVNAWMYGLDLIERNILIGIGPGAGSQVTPGNMPFHNTFISVFAETGIIGIGAYLCFIVFAIYSFYRSRDYRVGLLGAILFAAWTPIAMTGVWEVSLVAWMLFGWFLATPRLASQI
jgi:O-antigen ligase